MLQQDLLHLYTLENKESVMLNLNFLFLEPKLNSQLLPERVLLVMIKMEKCEIQNKLWDWLWLNHAMKGAGKKVGCGWQLTLFLSNFSIFNSIAGL